MAARKTRTTMQPDFSGGLNLNANAFVLGANEVSAISNMDLDLRGGVARRGGVDIFRSSVAVPGAPNRLFRHRGELFAQVDNRRIYNVKSGPSAVHKLLWEFPNFGNVEMASWGNKSYLQNGIDAPVVSGPNNAQALWPCGQPGRVDGGWSNDLEEPQAGTMPIAKLITMWSGATRGNFFVANTREWVDGAWVHYPSRIRWSHKSRLDGGGVLPPDDYRGVESWRQNADYMDLEPEVNDEEITAIRQFGDYLMVFKRNSIWALYADDPNNGIPYAKLLSRGVGTVQNKTTVSTERGVFFFSWPEGLFMWDGEKFVWLFEALMPLIDDGRITEASAAQITLGYHNRRLYLSVPLDGAKWNTHTFVYDPDIGERGAWTQWDLGFHNFLDWQHNNRSALLAVMPVVPTDLPLNSHPHVIDVTANKAQDRFATSLSAQPVPAFVQAAWVGDRNGALAQWRRPEYVVQSEAAMTLGVDVYHDFKSTPTRNHTLALSGGDMESPRGDLVGKARAVSLRIGDTAGTTPWQLQSITHKLWPGTHRL